MGAWNEIAQEIQAVQEAGSQFDQVRNKYLKELCRYTGRNVIAYYSGWLDKPSAANQEINDLDMTGFMNCVHGMDCSKGLDLVLHTPGGDPAATEAIVGYLRDKFGNDIRTIVPHLAMSAGTMVACAGSTIIMGRESSLGPIDPQFNGIPAYNIKQEFEEAKDDLSRHPENAQYWAIKLQQYPAAFLKTACDAIDLSGELLEDWLGTCMFDGGNPSDAATIKTIVATLNEHDISKTHGRHIGMQLCRDIGLKVSPLEDDDLLQDIVLSYHHACVITFNRTQTVKIIESQNGKLYVSSSS